ELWNGGPVAATDPRHAAVPNLSWKDDAGVIHHNELAPWITDLDALPVPDFSLAGGTAECVIGGKKTVMVQTSRGCPFDCSFCSVTGMFGKKFRYRSVASILKELREYNTRGHFVFFCDDNFTANKRRAREPELVRLMKRAGCHTVFIGFESVNPKSLTEMKKSQSLEDIRQAIRVVQEAEIYIHGM